MYPPPDIINWNWSPETDRKKIKNSAILMHFLKVKSKFKLYTYVYSIFEFNFF